MILSPESPDDEDLEDERFFFLKSNLKNRFLEIY